MKAGYKTSEGWLTLASQVFGATLAVLGALGPVHPYVQVAFVVVGGLQSIVSQVRYLDKRTELKKLPPFYTSEEYNRKLMEGVKP